MSTIFTFLLRLFLVAAGLVLAASLAVAFAVMVLAWGLGAGWARLTGKPVSPFGVRMRSGAAFAQAFRQRAAQAAAGARPGVRPSPLRMGRPPLDVTDVEPRKPAA